jgi:hypothetical protein
MQRPLHALMRLLAAWRRSAALSRRYEGVSHLDHRVLEEIGLTREQVRHDAKTIAKDIFPREHARCAQV